MGLLLELLVESLPFLLEGSDEFLALIFRHKELLTVTLILLLNLHLTNEVIFVVYFILDLSYVFLKRRRTRTTGRQT